MKINGASIRTCLYLAVGLGAANTVHAADANGAPVVQGTYSKGVDADVYHALVFSGDDVQEIWTPAGGTICVGKARFDAGTNILSVDFVAVPDVCPALRTYQYSQQDGTLCELHTRLSCYTKEQE